MNLYIYIPLSPSVEYSLHFDQNFHFKISREHQPKIPMSAAPMSR